MGTISSAPVTRRRHGLKYYLSYARSLLLTDSLIYVYTGVCGTLSLAGSVFDAQGRWQHAMARAWSRLILWTAFVRVRAEGQENIDRQAGQVFCVNHQSMLDIPVLFASLPVPFRFVAKRSLFRVPFMGWHLTRSGHIPVDRDRPRQALKSFNQAARRIREGTCVVLFPEGHRSRDGQMLPFKAGSFYLAILSGVPIVPITLNGTRRAMTPGTLHLRPGKVEMIVHKPVPTVGLTLKEADRLMEQVRETILSRFVPAEE
jgi:1-acyl-sn-glycerol-3-phosphate acyltransferase